MYQPQYISHLSLFRILRERANRRARANYKRICQLPNLGPAEMRHAAGLVVVPSSAVRSIQDTP